MATTNAAAAKTASGGQLIYLITYLLTWLTGIIVFVTEGQKNKRAKFHAIQAILLGVVIFILAWIPFVGWLIGVLLWLYGLYIGYQAGYQGKDIEFPVIGGFAKSSSA
ncbi:MAG: hypothetical protein KGH94_05415 [Candidatus Micrarchaeota archaeon]|nr:hypothetical protein [Candidatus Micrarchaeota archaeon]